MEIVPQNRLPRRSEMNNLGLIFVFWAIIPQHNIPKVFQHKVWKSNVHKHLVDDEEFYSYLVSFLFISLIYKHITTNLLKSIHTLLKDTHNRYYLIIIMVICFGVYYH